VGSVFSSQWFVIFWRDYDYDGIFSFKLDWLFGLGNAGSLLSTKADRQSNHMLHGRGVELIFLRCSKDKGWIRGLLFL